MTRCNPVVSLIVYTKMRTVCFHTVPCNFLLYNQKIRRTAGTFLVIRIRYDDTGLSGRCMNDLAVTDIQ